MARHELRELGTQRNERDTRILARRRLARRTRGGKGAEKEEEKPWHEALGDAIAASPIGKMFGMGKKSSRSSVVEKVAEPEPAAAAPVRRSSRLRN